jgi:glycine cleavage system aminomethyltransferase T
MPRNFRLCCQAGREYGIQLLLDTQEPHRVNFSVIGQTTELVCFRLQEPKAWDCIRALGADVERVKGLPPNCLVIWMAVKMSKRPPASGVANIR